jgi:hypothetical protein
MQCSNVTSTILRFVLLGLFNCNCRFLSRWYNSNIHCQSWSILQRGNERCCSGSVLKSHALIPRRAYKWFQRKYCWNDKSTREATRSVCCCHSLKPGHQILRIDKQTWSHICSLRPHFFWCCCCCLCSWVADFNCSHTHTLAYLLTHPSTNSLILRNNTRINWLQVKNRMCAMQRN